MFLLDLLFILFFRYSTQLYNMTVDRVFGYGEADQRFVGCSPVPMTDINGRYDYIPFFDDALRRAFLLIISFTVKHQQGLFHAGMIVPVVAAAGRKAKVCKQ